MKPVFYLLILIILGIGCSAQKEEKRALISELDQSLRTEILEAWYPRSIDSVYGGFLSNFSFDWKPSGPQNKMIVTQTRHLWTLSEIAMFYKNERYREIATHGYHFLRDKMWDKEYGGFYTTLSREGIPGQTEFGGAKMAYGNSFAIYALTSYYNLTQDKEALELAKNTFLWLEKFSHDPVYGGYFNSLPRAGSPLSVGGMEVSDAAPSKQIPEYNRISQKDQNTTIHLLEAFTQLYKVWPEKLLRQRLQELYTLLTETIVTEKGYLTLFLERDWKPISNRDSSEAYIRRNITMDHVSFGHDIETAFLLLEASQVLNGKPDRKILALAKKMVGHTIDNGWDKTNGGIYDRGYYFKGADTIAIVSETKVWWSEAEAMNSLLLMSELYPEEPKYVEYFLKQWNYIKTYQIDHSNKEWYEEGLDNSPRQVSAAKAHDWKVNYHNSRALMNCIKMLREDFELTEGH